MEAQANPIGRTAARFIAAAPERTYAPEVLDIAKRCLVDWMGVTIGGHGEPLAPMILRLAASWDTGGRARIVLGPLAAPGVAALVNGTLAHAQDFDDTHPDALGHISAPTWAAVFSLATHHGCSEAEALSAFITGFEVAGRLFGPGMGAAIQVRGFHPTAVFGRFAATAAACALLRLDEAHTANALGVAATTAGGLIASLGTMSKPFHAGKGAMDGVLAAHLAGEGFEAATHLLDADNGLAGAFVQDRSVRFEATEFSEGLQLKRNAFKPYACCKGTHPTVDAGRALADAVKGQRIERVVLTVNPMHKRIAGKERPQTPLEAKFSLSFCAALGLRGYAASATDFVAERVADPDLRDLEARVAVNPSPDIPTTSVHCEVVLADGRKLEHHVPVARGNPENPLTWDDLHAKFTGLVAPRLGADSEPLFETLRDFDRPGQLARAERLVTPPAPN